MSAARPSFDFRLIDTPAGSLPCIVRGPTTGPQVMIVPPLFEEMNRTRMLLAGVGRALAEHGIGSWLPDLPGTGDSDRRLADISWQSWRDALTHLSQHITASHRIGVLCFSVRGGALLDDAAAATMTLRLAPVASGERMLRELLRARSAADQERGTPTSPAELERRLSVDTLELGGYPITPSLADALRTARMTVPASGSTAALAGGTADRIFDGPPVWRQAEPMPTRTLAGGLAHWIASCAGR